MAERDMYEWLTSVGPGTPMGNLFRRFWLPALLAKEVSEPDGTPVRIRILGEDLIAFKDTDGRVGILGAYCTHRAAPLFFGRNEQCGLRCVYHGWKFNVDGECVDIPNITPPERMDTLKEKVSTKSYPTREAGGIIWVYMGPRDKMPELPGLEWLKVPPSHVNASRWLHRSNWLQAAEGEIDTSHISFLHSLQPGTAEPVATPERSENTAETASALDRDYGVVLKIVADDGAPHVEVKEMDYGFVYGARRDYEGQYYWRMTQWMLPMWSAIPGSLDEFLGGGRAWVPIDDSHTMAFGYKYCADRPLSEQEIADIDSGAVFPPRGKWGSTRLPHGYVIDAFLPEATIENDYLIDRKAQATDNYTGIWGVNEQDRALQESMPSNPGQPGVVDRSVEHLVKSDLPIMAARRLLLRTVKALDKGIEPVAANSPESYFIRAYSVITPLANFDDVVKAHGHLADPGSWPSNCAPEPVDDRVVV